MSPLMTVGEFALATGLSAKALRFYDERSLLAPADVDAHSGYRRYAPAQIRTAAQIRVLRAAGVTVDDVRSVLADPASLPARLEAHAAELRRRRDLEDRGLALTAAGVYATLDPDDDGDPARPGPVAERTVGPTPWAGVVQRVALDEAGEEATTERVNAAFATLFQALAEAGSAPAGPPWTALRPVPGAADVVETVLALPLSGPAPAGLRVDGHEVVTGTLPRRVERYVDVRADASEVDLLDDAPGGALPHPGLLGLMDAFDVEDAGAAPEIRQILAVPEAGHVELAVTVREEAGAGQG
ncbi:MULTISPECIES: MerR family transcriptional regulator [Micrococcus]|uniref:MerR family transcriptional regulator n=1 Tax=Micrococcus TaxID=1269 RepID=UPI000BA75F09|nr:MULTISPECIES: MerR family transcriptional regulator [Micrococcus]PAL18530.1 transcriptional regulator [Micrococcus luteus]QGY91225.1 MerR family transcriptional regulator [Micrococcus luteus]